VALSNGAFKDNQHFLRLRPEHRRLISFRPAVLPSPEAWFIRILSWMPYRLVGIVFRRSVAEHAGMKLTMVSVLKLLP